MKKRPVFLRFAALLRNFLLDNIAVDPDYQGRRFGRKLIAFAEDRVKSARLNLLTLYTNEQMISSEKK